MQNFNNKHWFSVSKVNLKVFHGEETISLQMCSQAKQGPV